MTPEHAMAEQFDVLIAGGGPAGATAAIVLARAGLRVCVLEKDTHPRFHIGESILPRTIPLLRELGLEETVLALPHVPKYGAEFGMGDDHKTRKFQFTDGLLPGFRVFNIERSLFDHALLGAAREAGADVREGTPVKEILSLAHENVRVRTAGGELEARVLIDASGGATLVGRALGLRRNFDDPDLQKVAYFQHFDHVERPEGTATGHPAIIMCDEGWFWLIGISETRTSVGFVTRPSFAKTLSVPPRRMLAWAAQRCPVVRHRMRDAVGEPDNMILSDFSYTCRPYAGDGYFLVGDAACFLDPIFSTGVTLAMMSAQHAAQQTLAVLGGATTASRARRRHHRFVSSACDPFWRLIRGYYKHPFRELFMEGQGPLQMQKAVVSILAGQVFPKPVWALRWRQRAFEASVFLQRYAPLVPRRAPCRLVEQAEAPLAVFSGDSSAAAPSPRAAARPAHPSM